MTPFLVSGLPGSVTITADQRAGQTQLSTEGTACRRLANSKVDFAEKHQHTHQQRCAKLLAAQAIVCRPPTAFGIIGQLNSSSVVVQQNQDALHARDADILNVFLANSPTPVPTAPPTCVPGKPTDAVMPAQHISGYMGGASASTPSNARKETPMPPGPCRATDLGNLQTPAKLLAGTSLRLRCWGILLCMQRLSHFANSCLTSCLQRGHISSYDDWKATWWLENTTVALLLHGGVLLFPSPQAGTCTAQALKVMVSSTIPQ